MEAIELLQRYTDGLSYADFAGDVRFRGNPLTTGHAGLPRFLHALTLIHAVGALACMVMAIGSAASTQFRESLAVSGGSRIMVDAFGATTWLFLAFIGSVLAILAHASWRVRPWAWHMTLVVYGIGVLGSLWQVSVGIREGWMAVAVNGAVLVYASRRSVREAYLRSDSTYTR